MAEPRFFTAEKRKKPWQIVVLVDESGSMGDSIIYSVVMASIFSSLPAIHTNLAIFDTQVVDLSDKLNDPVDVLMSVQLGGGTDITKAVRYGRSLFKNPKKSILVIISDFYEGRSEYDLTKELKQVLEGETKVLGIAALGFNCGTLDMDGYTQLTRDYAEALKGTNVLLLAEPNAGRPDLEDGKTVYKLSPADFAQSLVQIKDAGAVVLGGCCGTRPAHLAAAVKAIRG